MTGVSCYGVARGWADEQALREKDLCPALMTGRSVCGIGIVGNRVMYTTPSECSGKLFTDSGRIFADL